MFWKLLQGRAMARPAGPAFPKATSWIMSAHTLGLRCIIDVLKIAYQFLRRNEPLSHSALLRPPTYLAAAIFRKLRGKLQDAHKSHRIEACRKQDETAITDSTSQTEI